MTLIDLQVHFSILSKISVAYFDRKSMRSKDITFSDLSMSFQVLQTISLYLKKYNIGLSNVRTQLQLSDVITVVSFQQSNSPAKHKRL